jgi:uncharacterized coiled-coil DUF342 family protein
MTEEAPNPGLDEILKQLDEMKAKFDEQQKAYDATLDELRKQNADLTETNKGLQREIIRRATTEPPEEKKEPTEEEQRAALITSISQRTLKILGCAPKE